MNYRAHYNSLVARAKNRVLIGYTEQHHIIPRCLGGSNEKSNLVRLTAEEHYVAHQLLVKIYPANSKLAFAVIAMTSSTDLRKTSKNKAYSWLRIRHAEAVTLNNPMHSIEVKEKHSKSVNTKSHRKTMSNQVSGKKNPMYGKACTWKEKGKDHPMLGKKQTEEAKQKIAKASKDKILSSETKAKMSAAQKIRRSNERLNHE